MTSRKELLMQARKRRSRRLRLAATAATASFAALFGLLAGLSTSNPAAATPVAGGYFTTLPPGSVLPTEASCAARVHRSAWEPRSDNYAANHKAPPQVHLIKSPDFAVKWNTEYEPRITGNFSGTTDEIIQWAACKWGWSDELVRAEGVVESNWHQNAAGDFEPSSRGHCTAGDTRASCPTSFGFLQIRWYYHPGFVTTGGSYPSISQSTAFNLDYALAELRGCYDGLSTYLGNTRGDQLGCIGSWYSGDWRGAGALSYIQKVQSALTTKAWMNWPDQSASLPAGVTQPPRTSPATLASTSTSAAPSVTRPTTAPPTTAKPATPVTTTTTRPTDPNLAELRKLREELQAYCASRGC